MEDPDKTILDDLIRGLPALDIDALAKNFGLSICFAKWHPVTAGEMSFAKREIVVNENAPVPAKQVIAHELGHFLLRLNTMTITDEEKFCDRFAERLIAARNDG